MSLLPEDFFFFFPFAFDIKVQITRLFMSQFYMKTTVLWFGYTGVKENQQILQRTVYLIIVLSRVIVALGSFPFHYFKPALGVEHCCCKGCVCSENGLRINNMKMDVVADQAILNMSLLYSFSGGITTHMTSFLLLQSQILSL